MPRVDFIDDYSIRDEVLEEERSGSKLWLLVCLPVIVIPFEDHYTLTAFSYFIYWGLVKLAVIPLLIGVLIFRPAQFFAMWRHPVFLTGMAFLAWGAVAEAFQPDSNWKLLYSVFQMLVFAVLIATESSNLIVFRRVLMAIALVCSFLAFYLVFNFYGAVNVDATSYEQAERIRYGVFYTMDLDTNLNILGYTVGLGAPIALARLLDVRGLSRIFWGGVYIICALGAMIPLSRGALLALMAASGVIVLRNMVKPGSGKAALAIVLMLLALVLMPKSLVERLSPLEKSTSEVSREEDSRVRLYSAAIESIPEYWALGVGYGYYRREWALDHGFGKITADGDGHVLGPHNGFFAAWIYYGFPGLILLGLICLVAVRQYPRGNYMFWEVDALLGLMVLGGVWLFFTHNLDMKAFGVVLGLLMGASRGALGQTEEVG